MSSPRAAKPPSAPPPDPTPTDTRTQADRPGFTLGPNDLLVGRLQIEGDLQVGGRLEGEVQATGDVEIGDMAKVKASVAGRKVNIRGHVSGQVTATERLVVARTGSLFGDVRVARLVVQDGATFSGHVSMGGVAAPATPAAEASRGAPAAKAELPPAVKAEKARNDKAKPEIEKRKTKTR